MADSRLGAGPADSFEDGGYEGGGHVEGVVPFDVDVHCLDEGLHVFAPVGAAREADCVDSLGDAEGAGVGCAVERADGAELLAVGARAIGADIVGRPWREPRGDDQQGQYSGGDEA